MHGEIRNAYKISIWIDNGNSQGYLGMGGKNESWRDNANVRWI
jgi:hypothetical protein